MCLLLPQSYLADIFRENPFSGNFVDASSKKIFKIDFFRFFQKCIKLSVDVIYGLETHFKHFLAEFPAIFDDLFIILTKFKKIEILKKIHFLRFFAKIQFSENYRFGYKKASKIQKFFRIKKYGP